MVTKSVSLGRTTRERVARRHAPLRPARPPAARRPPPRCVPGQAPLAVDEGGPDSEPLDGGRQKCRHTAGWPSRQPSRHVAARCRHGAEVVENDVGVGDLEVESVLQPDDQTEDGGRVEARCRSSDASTSRRRRRRSICSRSASSARTLARRCPRGTRPPVLPFVRSGAALIRSRSQSGERPLARWRWTSCGRGFPLASGTGWPGCGTGYWSRPGGWRALPDALVIGAQRGGTRAVPKPGRASRRWRRRSARRSSTSAVTAAAASGGTGPISGAGRPAAAQLRGDPRLPVSSAGGRAGGRRRARTPGSWCCCAIRWIGRGRISSTWSGSATSRSGSPTPSMRRASAAPRTSRPAHGRTGPRSQGVAAVLLHRARPLRRPARPMVRALPAGADPDPAQRGPLRRPGEGSTRRIFDFLGCHRGTGQRRARAVRPMARPRHPAAASAWGRETRRRPDPSGPIWRPARHRRHASLVIRPGDRGVPVRAGLARLVGGAHDEGPVGAVDSQLGVGRASRRRARTHCPRTCSRRSRRAGDGHRRRGGRSGPGRRP